MDALDDVDACVMIVDVLDFEGSFIPLLAEAARGKLLVAANKVDLLPSKTPVEEVVGWIEDRLARHGIGHHGVYTVSARSGFGVRVLLEAAGKVAGKAGKVALVGATNVGKSTLINRWLKGTDEEGPTVSRFPGTTLGLVARSVSGAEIDVLDTPGLASPGRMTDILCPTCASRLVPEAPVTSKLIRVAAGHSVVVGGLAAFTPQAREGEEHMLLAFAAADVPIHRVRDDKMPRYLAGEARGGEDLLCEGCRKTLSTVGWEQVRTDAAEMEDVAVHGLGWISPRRKGMRVTVTLPAGVMASTRPRLIGPKTPIQAPRT